MAFHLRVTREDGLDAERSYICEISDRKCAGIGFGGNLFTRDQARLEHLDGSNRVRLDKPSGSLSIEHGIGLHIPRTNNAPHIVERDPG